MPAKRKTAAAEAAPSQPIPAESIPTPPAAEAAPAEQERRPYPDPREQKQVTVSPTGDKLRLLRSDRFKQLQIGSDRDLPLAAKQRLHAAGWRDRTEEEGIWTKQLPPLPEPGTGGPEPTPSRRRMVFEAERLFEEIANAMRSDHKMPPVRLGGAEPAR